MKKLKLSLSVLISIFFLINEMSFSQATFDWAKSYSYPGNNSQIPYDMVTDTNGNFYMTGSHSRGYSVVDMVTVKYNASGQFQWARTFNTSSDYVSEIGQSIAAYRNGAKTYIYVSGAVNYQGGSHIHTIKYDENGNELWNRNYDPGIPLGNDNLKKVIADASGNCYITGDATTHAFIVKYDSTGTSVFATLVPNLTGYSYPVVNDMDIDPAGNIYVTGSSDTASSKYYFTFKYNSTGVLQWSKVIKGPLNSQSSAKSIKIGASGNIYITGIYQGATLDYMTTKCNPATGDTVWTRKFNGTGNGADHGKLLSLDASENIFVTGVTNYTGNGDMATIKYNSSGVQQWVKVFAGPGGYLDDPRDMVIDNTGRIYITFALDLSYFGKFGVIKYNTAGDTLWTRSYDVAVGEFEAPFTMALDKNLNVIVTGSSGNDSDFGMLKYSSAGVLKWVRKFYAAEITHDIANSVVTDKNGNAYVVGKARTDRGDNIQVIKYNSAGVRQWVYNTAGGGTGYDAYDAGNAIAIDTSGNLYITGTVFSHPNTHNDIFVRKLDSNGNSIWVNFKSGPGFQYGDDEGNDIALDASGNVYVGGQWTGPAGDIGFITIKYNSSGVEQWSRGYNGNANSNDKLKDLEIDISGNVYVTGTTRNSGTNGDITTIKYNSSGVEQWVKFYNGNANHNDTGNAVKADKLGNVYVCGSEVDLSSGSNSILIKYNAAGNQVWSRRHSSLDSSTDIDGERASALGITSNDSIIYIAGTGKFYNGPCVYYYNKFNSDGSDGVAVMTLAEGVKVTGSVMDDMNSFYYTGSVKTANGGESYDNFVEKINEESGTWMVTYDGLCNKDEFTGNKNPIAVSKNGAVFIAGSTYDTITGNTMNLVKIKQSLYNIGVTVFIEGFNIGNNVRDTVQVLLRNSSSPYNIVDSAKTKLGPNYRGYFNLTNSALTSSYYIVVKHRNTIETWSAVPQSFNVGYLDYDFTDDSTKAYGNNVRGYNFGVRKYALYGGDVNQDGNVESQDLTLADNDAFNFVTGYVNTDVTGDNVVDANDLAIIDNNAFNFVSKMRP